MTRGKVGILAGTGALPSEIAATINAAGGATYSVFLAPPSRPPAEKEGVVLSPAKVGKVIAALRAAGCKEIVLAGQLARPEFDKLVPDWEGAKLLPRIVKAARTGDDAILRELVAILEEKGFHVVGIGDVAPDLLAPRGPIGKLRPSARDGDDIAKAGVVIEALGRFDVGQAAVVRNGHVLAVEAAEGTDRMLHRCREFRQEHRAGVLVKLTKPGQERRADLPTVGLATVEACTAAGLSGIAVEAGSSIIVERRQVMAAADAAGLFVVGVDRPSV